MPDPDNSVLETWLAEVEAEIADKLRLAADLRRRLGLDPSAVAPTPSSMTAAGVATPVGVGRIRPDEFFRMSMPEAIQRYLSIMKQPQGPKAIVDGLKAGGLLTNSKHFYANVTTALKRLRMQDKAVLTPNGWGLAEWYPSKPKLEVKKAKRKGKKHGSTVAGAQVQKPASGFREFIRVALKDGKSMKQAGEEWRALKAAASSSTGA